MNRQPGIPGLQAGEDVNSHLQEITGDKHLRVRPGDGPRPDHGAPGPRPAPDGAQPADHEARRLAMRQMGRLDNFGIRRVERLDGNIGYLDVRRVAVPANAGPAICAAMELVTGTYALIIDLRHNGGGSPEGVVFWCSYLFTEEPATSTTSSTPIPARPGSSGPCRTCPEHVTSTVPSTH